MRPLDVLELKVNKRGWVEVPDDLLAKASGSTIADLCEFYSWTWTHRQEEEFLRARPGYAAHLTGHLRDIANAGFALIEGEHERGPARARVRGANFQILEVDHRDLTTFEQVNEDFCQALRRQDMPVNDAFNIAAAFKEMVDNALEHARAPVPPIAAYEVDDAVWRYSVTDVGVGVLESMTKNPNFASLTSATEALKLALTEGHSGTACEGRGNGLTWIFRTLSGRNAQVRLRSDTALAKCAGRSLTRQQLTYTPSSRRLGFHVTVEGARL